MPSDANAVGGMLRVAAVQMNSQADVADNLARAAALIERAAEAGCSLVVLPENFALMPKQSRDLAPHAEALGDAAPIQRFLAQTARQLGVWIVAGSLPLQTGDEQRVFGACLVVGADGAIKACYRKIHLFDVSLPDSDESYQESYSMLAGDTPTVVDSPIGRIGLSICYDVRFPELYRHLIDDGATVLTVPAAFTAVTGAAHWRSLLRARAIENLAYVIAAGQTGEHPDGRTTHGHSMLLDPWGRLLAEQPQGEGVVTADIDPALPARLRSEFPALDNRRIGQRNLERQ